MGQSEIFLPSVNMSVVNQLISRISDVNLSNLNYELGKAKENIVCESENYLGNFKTDASMVTNIIKTESSRLNETYFDGKIKIPTLQKSMSLPHFKLGVPNIQGYQYYIGKGGSPQSNNLNQETKAYAEKLDIKSFERNFLDSFNEAEEEEMLPKNTSQHMQMCFIDDGEEESDDDLFLADEGKQLSFFDVEIKEASPRLTIKQTMQNAKEFKLHTLKTKLKVRLASCKENATKETQTFMNKMISENPLSKLLGLKKDNWELLEEYEAEFLRETIKELKVKITEYNSELVNLIEEKDNLEQPREEIIVDIKDLSSLL